MDVYCLSPALGNLGIGQKEVFVVVLFGWLVFSPSFQLRQSFPFEVSPLDSFFFMVGENGHFHSHFLHGETED